MKYGGQLVTLWLVAVAIVFLPPPVRAQRRGEIVEGLLRGFLEVQLKKERQKSLERQQAADRYRHIPPPSVPGSPRPAPARVSPEIQASRTTLNQFARQSAALADGMHPSLARVRGARPLMADVLRLKTTAALMYGQAQKSSDFALLREEFGCLDCQWRDLSFQLQQLRGWDANTIGQIRQLDGCCDRLCRVMELEPQFDREAVFRLSVETTAYLTTLLDDIQYELYGRPGAAPLVGECRRLVEQSRRMSGLASGAPYDDLLTKYAAFVSNWRTFAAEVYAFENPYCGRSVRRIRSCNRGVFDRLRRPLPIDRTYLTHVSHMIAYEVDLLLENMTVKALVQMPPNNQQAVLDTARQLYGQCSHYCDCVEKDSTLNDLMMDYIEINNQWASLDGYLAPVTSARVVASRRLISEYDTELCGLLHVPATLDRAHAMQLAASLEELAEQLRYDVRRYARYYRTDSFRNQAYQNSDTFYVRAQNLHAYLQKGAGIKELRAGCNGVVTDWASLTRVISAMPANGVSSSRYQFVDESRQEVLPVIAELTMLLGA